jgi:hypothetical protein
MFKRFLARFVAGEEVSVAAGEAKRRKTGDVEAARADAKGVEAARADAKGVETKRADAKGVETKRVGTKGVATERAGAEGGEEGWKNIAIDTSSETSSMSSKSSSETSSESSSETSSEEVALDGDAIVEDVDDVSLHTLPRVVVDEERAAQRAALGPRLTEILVNVQVEHEHQRACALLLAERFARGDPGALLSMDTGLGKTHVMFLLVGALLQVGVPCVVATERALEANLLERFKAVWPGVDVSRLEIIVSGAAPSHRVVLERAIASIEGDGVVFIDEVSRYDGVESAMNEALERSPFFRVGISATPFTSCIEQLVGLALICGIVSDENSQNLRSCLDRSCLDLVTRHACADSCEAARELKTFVDSFTVGVRALSERYPDVTAALCEQVNRVEMTCKVRILKPSETQTRTFDEYLAAMETRRGARGQILNTCARAELVPMGADAVSADSVLELMRDVVMEEESKIVIFVPSCIASIAAMLWAHLRSRMSPWHVGLIDKDAHPDQRAEILRSFNSTDESTAIRILIATSETSGVGVDMTCAKRVVLPRSRSASVERYGFSLLNMFQARDASLF